MKLKKEFIKDVCVNKLLIQIDKRLIKRDKNSKSIENKKTMDPILSKSNMRKTSNYVKSTTSWKIIYNMGVIIPDPNTMKSNATASTSSPCPSSTEATIPKNTFHGH